MQTENIINQIDQTLSSYYECISNSGMFNQFYNIYYHNKKEGKDVDKDIQFLILETYFTNCFIFIAEHISSNMRLIDYANIAEASTNSHHHTTDTSKLFEILSNHKEDDEVVELIYKYMPYPDSDSSIETLKNNNRQGFLSIIRKPEYENILNFAQLYIDLNEIKFYKPLLSYINTNGEVTISDDNEIELTGETDIDLLLVESRKAIDLAFRLFPRPELANVFYKINTNAYTKKIEILDWVDFFNAAINEHNISTLQEGLFNASLDPQKAKDAASIIIEYFYKDIEKSHNIASIKQVVAMQAILEAEDYTPEVLRKNQTQKKQLEVITNFINTHCKDTDRKVTVSEVAYGKGYKKLMKQAGTSKELSTTKCSEFIDALNKWQQISEI